MRSPEITTESLDGQTTGTQLAPKILVAEDAPDLRDAMVLVLTEQGYYVQTVNDGLEATKMVSEFGPDLVILDMRMPKMSGSNACAAIRKTSDVPIIMFTSSNDAAEVRDAILKGATDFVLKSTGVSVLTERVKYHLARLNSSSQDTAFQSTASQNPNVKTARVQRSAEAGEPIRTTSLIIDPDEESRNVVKAVITRLGQDVIEVGTAAEAIRAFEQHGPDILITEWSLPDMDAFKMLAELKRDRPPRNAGQVYKFIMSARISPEAHRKARFAGITSFLYKPLDNSKVEAMVGDRVRRALRNLKRQASKAA